MNVCDYFFSVSLTNTLRLNILILQSPTSCSSRTIDFSLSKGNYEVYSTSLKSMVIILNVKLLSLPFWPFYHELFNFQ